MRVITNDGLLLTGAAEEIIEQMHHAALRAAGAPFERRAYMEEVAFRLKEWNGTVADLSTPDAFVRSLIEGGVLRCL